MEAFQMVYPSRIELFADGINTHDFDDDNLQNMCVREVIHSFERFYLASCKSNDKRIHRGIGFLQKKYSAFIADELNFADCMKSEYCSIIINKHLKRIDSRWFTNVEDSKVLHEKIKEIGDAIEYFDATHFEGPICKDILRFLPNLKHFKHETGFEEVLEALNQYCNNLETLTFDQIGKDGMRFLGTRNDGKAAFPRLKVLEISCMSIKQTDVQFILKNLRALETLYYLNCSNIPVAIYELHIADLKKNMLCNVEPYNITKLNFEMLEDGELTNALKICATVCPNVREVKVSVYSQENVNACVGFSNIEVLELGNDFSKSRINITDLLQLRGAKLVTLSLKYISVSSCTLIQNCQKLQRLILHDVDLDSAPQTCLLLHSKINIKDLSLGNMTLNESKSIDSLDHILKSCQSLNSLSFTMCEISNEFEQVLLNFCKKCTLRELEVYYTKFGRILEDILYVCSSLKRLKLRHRASFSEAVDMISLRAIADIIPNKPFVDFDDMESDDISSDDYDDYDDYIDVTDDSDDYDLNFEVRDYMYDSSNDLYPEMYDFFWQ